MPTDPEPMPPIQLLFSLAAALLDAEDAETILHNILRSGCDLLGAQGGLFLPFDEFAPRWLPLAWGCMMGVIPGEVMDPAQRQTCKMCIERFAGRECSLLVDAPQGCVIRCFPLELNGREAGVFGFVWSQPPALDESRIRVLEEVLHLGARALNALENRQWAQQVLLFSARSERSTLPPQEEARIILEERARLSREIHDGLAQTLAFLKIEIARAERFLTQGGSELAGRILRNALRTLDDAYLDARQAIENLRRIPERRLAIWLTQAAEEFEALSGLPVQVEVRLTHDLPINTQVQVMRIVQEALTNIRKHAQAQHVRLIAWEDGEEIGIEVADDGQGFSPETLSSAAHFGLRGMRERAEAIGAEFQIVSRPKQGTIVRLRCRLWERVNL